MGDEEGARRHEERKKIKTCKDVEVFREKEDGKYALVVIQVAIASVSKKMGA